MKRLIMGINPGTMGLNYHDPSVCLVDEESILFSIEEERLNGIRHSTGMFPQLACKECVQIAEKNGREITDIAVGHQPVLWKYRENANFKDSCDPRTLLALQIKRMTGLRSANVFFYEHHKSHAASAFFCSGFQQALCVVIDGAGELASASVWIAQKNELRKIDEILMPNSLGYFYAQMTAYLGFKPWSEEGKLMALAPYGHEDFAISGKLDTWFFEKDVYDVSSIVNPCLKNGFLLDVDTSNHILTKIFDHPPRKSSEEILTFHKDLAFCVQSQIERTVKEYIKKWIDITGVNNLCCAGGLFMNCKMNGYLRDNLKIKKFFVQPVAGDAGTAMGAALLNLNEDRFQSIKLNELSLGKSYSNEEIFEVLKNKRCTYKYYQNVCNETARLLSENKIVVWFEGKSELGCRALCHRSILASPMQTNMADEINLRIKHREVWRPFACSILADFADDILQNFEKSQDPSYMIEAFKINEIWIDKMRAVIHKCDNSTRPQVVKNKGVNKKIYSVIKEFYNLTGCPLVLNTSLNDKGQPIITTPEQAICFFEDHDVDALVIGDYILRK